MQWRAMGTAQGRVAQQRSLPPVQQSVGLLVARGHRQLQRMLHRGGPRPCSHVLGDGCAQSKQDGLITFPDLRVRGVEMGKRVTFRPGI